MSKYALSLLAAGLLAYGGTSLTVPAEATGDVTVVTSDKLTYDAKEQYAVFDGNVVVTDPEVQMTADRLILKLDDAGDPEVLRASGNVVITHADKKSLSGLALYEVKTGKFVLTDKPRVSRGRDILQGDTITFWRGQDKLLCEPRARLVIYPQGDGHEQLFGD
jgi:lipopolysaccharide transport protein LptA